MISEADLLTQLQKFEGWTYHLTKPCYPEKIRGVSLPIGPPNRTNCSCFVEGLLIPLAYREPSFLWDKALHSDMMILDPARLLSPIDALISTELATATTDPKEIPPWTVAQGWRSNNSGHLFIIVRHDLQTDKCLILEASGRFNGVGWRGIGTIQDTKCTIPTLWSMKTEVTYQGLKKRFPLLGLATLNLNAGSEPTNESPSSHSQSPSLQELGSSSSTLPEQPRNGGAKSSLKDWCRRLHSSLWVGPPSLKL